MSVKLVKVASVIGLSSFKHTLGGVPLAASYQEFSFQEIVLYTAIGGFIGLLTMMFFHELFKEISLRYFPNKKKKRTFTKMNRLIIKVKKNFGLPGIAFITPWLLSIPLGTVISCSIYKNKKKVLLFQGLSILLWSVIGAAIAHPFSQL